MELIQLKTGADVWIVVRIDPTTAVQFPLTWWDAFKLRWLPFLKVNYTKPFRTWHVQGVYSDTGKAIAGCEDEQTFYFPMLLNVAYPRETVEVQCVFPLRNESYSLRELS